jgi:hypothetical protein
MNRYIGGVNPGEAITEGEARSLGYVVSDMVRGGIDFCLVRVTMLPEVWRKGFQTADDNRRMVGKSAHLV